MVPLPNFGRALTAGYPQPAPILVMVWTWDAGQGDIEGIQGELIAPSGAVTPVARLHSPNTRDGCRLGAWFLGAALNAPGRYRLRLRIEDARNPNATNTVCLAQTEFMDLSPPPNSKQDNR